MSTTAPSLQSEDCLENAHLPAWKAELNAKLLAHRSRQERPETPVGGRTPATASAGGSAASRAMAAQVAARVAARYAKEPSYSDVLAARAVAAADAAHGAVLAAERAHEAAQCLLTSVADGPQIEGLVDSADSFFTEKPSGESVHAREMHDTCDTDNPWTEEDAWRPAAIIAHPEPLPIRISEPECWIEGRASEHEPRFPDPRLHLPIDLMAEATVAPVQPLLSKLIEFPRELVALHKPRPRLAEGPLLGNPAAADAQLRIFEVGNVQEQSHAECMQQKLDSLSAAEAQPYAAAAAPAWHSIRLGEHPQALEADPGPALIREQASVTAAPSAPLQTATIEDRVMASTVDFALIGIGFLLFVLVFAATALHVPGGLAGLLAAGTAFAGAYFAYHWLFMSYRGGTPGMRYAEIALCTFDDDNPTRTALRRRIGATLVAALPLGLGLVWALFDEDGVGWHDRMTRTYQRSYK